MLASLLTSGLSQQQTKKDASIVERQLFIEAKPSNNKVARLFACFTAATKWPPNNRAFDASL